MLEVLWPGPAVVIRALDLFASSAQTDFTAFADRLLKHGDADVRAAVVRAIWAVRPQRQQLEGLLGSDCACVHISAVVGPDGRELCRVLGSGADAGRDTMVRGTATAVVPVPRGAGGGGDEARPPVPPFARTSRLWRALWIVLPWLLALRIRRRAAAGGAPSADRHESPQPA